MVAYLIIDTKISDVDAYEVYKTQAKSIIEKFGGKYHVRGGEFEVIEGDLWEPTRMVVIEFADMDTARSFVNSPEYQPVMAIRHANAKCTVVLVDGL